MEQEGVILKPGCHIGVDLDAGDLRKEYDAVLLSGGATLSRDLPVPGRELEGIHLAMDYLPLQNKRCEGDEIPAEQFISAQGKHVIIIGGGDTGADCLGTVNRQGAKSVHQLEIMPKPPNSRAEDNPWPEWPRIYRVTSAHEEGVERVYAVSTKRFIGTGKGQVKELELVEVEMKNSGGRLTFSEVPGTEYKLPCDLALLAMGLPGAGKDRHAGATGY